MSSYETVYLSGIRYGLRQAMKDKNVSQEARAQQTRLSNDREHLRGELFRTKKQLHQERQDAHNQLRSLTHQWAEETSHLKEQIVKQSVSATLSFFTSLLPLLLLLTSSLCPPSVRSNEL